METSSYLPYKKDVAKWMRRLYKKGLTTSLGGNISVRINENLIAITSSETDKGKIKAREIAIVDMHGECIDEGLRVSMETEMHLALYRDNADVHAIVHAHPVLSSAFTAMSKTINTRLLAEAYSIVGEPVKASYALPGSGQLAQNVSEAARRGKVILMENHGVLATGESLLKAFDRIEVLENAAKMTVLTQLMGEENNLTSDQLYLLHLNFK